LPYRLGPLIPAAIRPENRRPALDYQIAVIEAAGTYFGKQGFDNIYNVMLTDREMICNISQVYRMPCRVDGVRIMLVYANKLQTFALKNFLQDMIYTLTNEIIADIGIYGCYEAYLHKYYIPL
jgi:hypothetical protein